MRAVSKAIQDGRLRASVGEDIAGRPTILDPEVADAEWTANTDTTRSPAPSTEDAPAIAEKYWRARLAELTYRQKSGELVEASEVARHLVDVFTACRTRLLGIPSRARQQLPHLSKADVATIEGMVREALEGLSKEG